MNNKEISNLISDLKKNCRTCFSASDEQIALTKTIVDYFKIFLNFTICKTDILPNQICLSCYNALLETRRFYLQCRDMETYLKMKIELLDSQVDTVENEMYYILEDSVDQKSNCLEYNRQDDSFEGHIEFVECESTENLNDETFENGNISSIENKNDLIVESIESSIVKEFKDDKQFPFQIETLSQLQQNCYDENNYLSDSDLQEEFLEEEHLTDFTEESEINERNYSNQFGKTQKDLVRELRKNAHECTLCDRVFLKEKTLNTHFKNDHKLTSENRICSKCRLIFDNENELLEHKNSKSCLKKFPCADCEKSFSSQVDLKTHQNIHTGEKPFECYVCNQKFRQKNTLKTHQTLHFGKNIKCELCGKNFARKSQLILHNRMHNNIKPFICDQCPSAFRELQHLNAHKITHTGIRSFQCNLCSGSFYHKKALDQHYYSVHRSKNIMCPLCNRKFNQNWRFRNHLEKVHKKNITESKIMNEDPIVT